MNIEIRMFEERDHRDRAVHIGARARVETSPSEGYDPEKIAAFEKDLGEFVDGRLNDALTGKQRIRNCDRFGRDPQKLHAAWWEWSGRAENCNSDGTVKLTYGEWLLALADGKGGDK